MVVHERLGANMSVLVDVAEYHASCGTVNTPFGARARWRRRGTAVRMNATMDDRGNSLLSATLDCCDKCNGLAG